MCKDQIVVELIRVIIPPLIAGMITALVAWITIRSQLKNQWEIRLKEKKLDKLDKLHKDLIEFTLVVADRYMQYCDMIRNNATVQEIQAYFANPAINNPANHIAGLKSSSSIYSRIANNKLAKMQTMSADLYLKFRELGTKHSTNKLNITDIDNFEIQIKEYMKAANETSSLVLETIDELLDIK